ncbi:nuclear transport factor 2 family protein [Massilia sp. METH4]|uniref:nuclear transport factor 2 family protein n=1 Tax=Massilia sp. METH4 TaxID=3123041 RepID=UPI0030CE1AE9
MELEQTSDGKQWPVSAEERSAVIDAVNRLNMAFDDWDIEAMVAAFTEEGIVHHARGEVRGHAELRRFYDAYKPLTLGVRRHALNHVVDKVADGTLRVTSYNLLVRVAPADEHEQARRQMVSEYDHLPGLFVHAVMVDTLRRDEAGGWRICERFAGNNSLNRTMRT